MPNLCTQTRAKFNQEGGQRNVRQNGEYVIAGADRGFEEIWTRRRGKEELQASSKGNGTKLRGGKRHRTKAVRGDKRRGLRDEAACTVAVYGRQEKERKTQGAGRTCWRT